MSPFGPDEPVITEPGRPSPARRTGRTITAVIGIVILGALAACGGGTASPSATSSSSGGFPVHTLTAGVIQFEADFTEPPGQVLVNGKMSGSDYEICNAVAAAAGLKPQWTNTDFGTLIPDLQAGRDDAACSSVDITAARTKVVNFVPYREDSQGAAVQPGNPKHVSSPSDLCGLSAAELLGSIYQKFVASQSATCVHEGGRRFS